jgi:F0F1-type ATP synthase membrane subunit a
MRRAALQAIRGRFHPAVIVPRLRASSAVPAVFQPVEIGTRTFVDGGLVAPVPVLMATAISMLELFVAFLQAFIFTLLASVFIGQIREAHH